MTKIVNSVGMEGGEGRVKPWGDAGVAMAMVVIKESFYTYRERKKMKPNGHALKKRRGSFEGLLVTRKVWLSQGWGTRKAMIKHCWDVR